MDEEATREASDAPPGEARLLRQIGKGLLGLNLKVDEALAALRAISPPAPAGALGEAEPPGFRALAAQLDGLDRVLEHLGRLLVAPGPPAPAAPPAAAPGAMLLGRVLGWVGLAGVLGAVQAPAAPPGGADEPRWAEEVAAAAEALVLLREKALAALAREGVTPAAAAGPFDPARHRVVGTAPGPPGEILRCIERGYLVRGADGEERPLRFGLVIVGAAPGAVADAREDS
jgi:hypothetical protein